MAAGVTPVDVASERRGATARDRAEHRSLLDAQPRMLFDEDVTLRVDDIGHLHGGSAHDWVGFRSNRDRWSTTGIDTCRRSSGCAAAGRCCRERCKYTVVWDRSA